MTPVELIYHALENLRKETETNRVESRKDAERLWRAVTSQREQVHDLAVSVARLEERLPVAEAQGRMARVKQHAPAAGVGGAVAGIIALLPTIVEAFTK